MVLALETSSATDLQTYLSFSLRSRAPGRRPASQRIWKPLQMPTTGMPSLAACTTAFITGLWAAMAPQRR